MCPANSLLVVRHGQYTGNLVVSQHRYYLGSGSYNWVFLLNPDGKELGTLADQDDPYFESRLEEVLKLSAP